MLDVFIASYDSSGRVLWAKSLGGTGNDESTGMSVDKSNSILCTGYFRSPMLFADGFCIFNSTNNNTYDIYVGKLSDVSGTGEYAGMPNSAMRVFPSPCTSKLTINGTSENGRISIYDISGKEILSQESAEDNTILDLSLFHPGVYILSYCYKNSKVYTKVIKN